MKRKIVFLGMLIVLLAGCASSPKGSNQMLITITGILSQYEGMVGAIMLDTGDDSENTAWSIPKTISGGISKNEMLDWTTDSEWRKDGTYRIFYIIYTDHNLDKDTASSYIVGSKNLTGNNSISFSQFVYIN